MMNFRVLVAFLSGMAVAGCGHDVSPPAGYSTTDQASLRRTFATDAGMHGLWSPDAYKDVGERNWEAHFVDNDSIENHIKRGEFVPIYVHSDGTPVIEVRVGSKQSFAQLSSQEQSWVKAESEPYLFVSTGVANVSGIEYIGGQATAAVAGIRVPPGRWVATVRLLSWPENLYNKDTNYPPDFVVTLNPETKAVSYRQVTDTFVDGTW